MLKRVFTFSFFTLLSRILGLIRDILIAFILGVQSLADVFFVAFRFPNLFRSLFAEGAVSVAFIYVSSLKLTNKEQIEEFSNNIFSIIFITMSLLCVIMWIILPYMVKYFTPGFYYNQYKFNLIVEITKIMLPYLLFISLSALLNSISQINGDFNSTALSPIILNICLIYTLIFFSSYQVVYNLAIAVWISGALQFALSLFVISGMYVDVTFKFNSRFDHDVKMFFKKIVSVILSNCMLQISVWIDTVFASFIPGAISHLYYADRINQLPQALIGTAIATVLFPLISKKIMSNDDLEATKLQESALELGLIFAIPATAGIAVMSESIVDVLFHYGNFSSSAVTNTSQILSILVFSLPAFVVSKVLLSVFYARGNFKIPNFFSLFSLFANVILNSILIKKYGYISLAISTTTSCWLNTILYMIYMRRVYSYKMSDRLLKSLTKVFFAMILMVLVISFANTFIEEYVLDGLYFKIVSTISVILLGIATYFIALNLMLKRKILFNHIGW